MIEAVHMGRDSVKRLRTVALGRVKKGASLLCGVSLFGAVGLYFCSQISADPGLQGFDLVAPVEDSATPNLVLLFC